MKPADIRRAWLRLKAEQRGTGMLIFLVRHGQTDWNLEGRFQGQVDIPLNENGVLQAREAGKALKRFCLGWVVSSPLARARVTGELIAQICDATFTGTDQRLIERHLGSYEGLFISTRPDYFVKRDVNDGSMEPLEQVAARMCAAVYALANGQDPVAVVSHGAALNALLMKVSGGTVGTGITRLVNGSISILERNEPDTPLRLLAYNLTPEELTAWQPE